MAVLAVPAAAVAQVPVGDEPADQRYIITFRRSPNASDRGVEAEALVAAGSRSVRATGGRVLRELPSVAAVAAWLPEEALEALRQDPKVERIEVDARRYLLQSVLQSGPPWTDTSQGGEIIPYGISMVQAGQLSDAAAGNRKVCIIDTGYYRGHDDLQYANVTATPDTASGDPFIDPHGHGTHVAGTIAAVGGNGIGVRGLNPSQRIKLHIIKAFGRFGTWTYSSDLVHAISKCREAGANILSMSFGGPEPVTAEATAFADAYAAGILPIAAAGNGGNSTYSYPASYASVVSVAAVDANEDVASFSQNNDDVELAAPGVAVLSSMPPPEGYAAWSGTSMATPHVAGVAALVWSYNPSWTNVQIRQALQQTAKDKGIPGRDWSFGYGIVQAKAALDYLCGRGCVPPPPPPEPASDCVVDSGEGDFLTGQSARVIVDAGGDVHLSGNFVERAETASSNSVGFTRTTWRAQTFTASVTGTLTAADLYLSCEGCYGYIPQVEISIWAMSGGIPTSYLASSNLFSLVGASWRKVELTFPLTVEAGKEYALVVQPWPDETTAGSYHWRLANGDTYPGGRHLVWTEDSGWTAQGGADLAFRVYLTALAGPYTNRSGWLVSSLMDSRVPAGGAVQWETLSWTATQPAGTSVRFQVAGSNSASGPFEFVGPDGTRDSFFTASGAPVTRFERYLRYRAELTTTDLAATPVLHDVTACFTTLRGSQTILRGMVTDALTGVPINGAAVVAGAYSATSDANGRYEMVGAVPGTYSLTASASGYLSKTLSNVPVSQGFATDRCIFLFPRVADTTPPSAPGAITSSHDGGAALADDTIEVAWEAATDAFSGVDGYSYYFNRTPVSSCERTKDAEEITLQATSAALEDGTWYVHVCAVDAAGNWGAVAHGGPYRIANSCRTDTTREQFQAGIASSVDLISSPGDVRLVFPGGRGALDQSQTAVGEYGQTITTTVWEAQIFTPGTSGFLVRLDVNLSCVYCSGPDPVLTVEIRDVVGSQPGDNILATTTIAGFSSPVPTFYTAFFSSPPGLTAGTPYAFVVKSQAERSGLYATNWINGIQLSGDRYEAGAYRFTVNSGASWEAWGADLAFRTYMAPANFLTAGTLESSLKDAGPLPRPWASLSWLTTSPASTSVQFQVAASNSPSGPFNFVGPDGTATTYFTTSGASLAQLGSARYVKYKVFLRTGVSSLTPVLHEVTLCQLVPGVIFADGFESGDTSAWSFSWP